MEVATTIDDVALTSNDASSESIALTSSDLSCESIALTSSDISSESIASPSLALWRMNKGEKDKYRLMNAHGVGVSEVMQYNYPELSPQLVHLRKAVLARDCNATCASWRRERLLEWLKQNPPSTPNAAPGLPRELQPTTPVQPGCQVNPVQPGSQLNPVRPIVLSISQQGTQMLKFRWNKHFEARLIALICFDPAAFLGRGGRLTHQEKLMKQTDHITFLLSCILRLL